MAKLSPQTISRIAHDLGKPAADLESAELHLRLPLAPLLLASLQEIEETLPHVSDTYWAGFARLEDNSIVFSAGKQSGLAAVNYFAEVTTEQIVKIIGAIVENDSIDVFTVGVTQVIAGKTAYASLGSRFTSTTKVKDAKGVEVKKGYKLDGYSYIIASMLLWKRHREVNKVDGAAELMEDTFSTLGAILGKPGRRFPVWDRETGSDEHLFTWPKGK